MKVPFNDLARHHAGLLPEIMAEIGEVFASSAFILGPKVAGFEQRFAELHNAPHCVGVNSGTSALHLALLALGVGPGDEVVVPALTFVATAWAASYTGATPVFCDVEEDTGLMDPKALERVLGPRTKAIIPVHLYGRPCDMDAINALAEKRGAAVVEDACQAHCAEYKGRRVGQFGAAACFSFYPGKNLGAAGEGGAVLTRDETLAGKVRMLRDHGQSRRYHHGVVGYNYRMEGIQGAVLGVKSRHIEDWTGRRRAVAAVYRRELAGLDGLVLPADEGPTRHVYHLFVVRSLCRDLLAEKLAARGVATGLHYPLPLHLQEAYAGLGHKKGDLPRAEAWADQCLSLPMFPEMREDEIAWVVGQCRAAVRECGC